MNFSTPQPWSE